MARLYEIFFAGLAWLGRLYGLFFLGLGVIFLYWSGRGLLALTKGIHAAWSDPVACAIGLIAGVLSLWAGSHLVRDRELARQFVAGRERDDKLMTMLDDFDRLEDSDLAAARQVVVDYVSRDEAETAKRRAELRQRAPHDVRAAVALRRELQNEIGLNAEFRQEVVKKWPEDQRVPMLAEIERTDREFQSEILALDTTIARLKS